MRVVALTFLLAFGVSLPEAKAAPPAPSSAPVPADKRVKVSIDRSKVNLDGHTLEVSLSQRADKVHLKVVGESGAVLAERDIAFNGAAPGTPLTCTWTPSSSETVARIEVIGHSVEGYWAGVAITPWRAEIPHEEVNFATDSDVIRPSETPKLEASRRTVATVLGKHTDLGLLTLYILGHTDTVGTPEHNFTLSQRRARAIGAWFKQHGIQVAIAYEGVGEMAPRVRTADEVDEPQNRRVDYVIAAEPPALPNTRGWHAL
jgi:hypothetical protein